MGNVWPWASPRMRDQMAREDYREARAAEQEEIARQERRELAQLKAEKYARDFEYVHGCSPHDYHEALSNAAVAAEMRKSTAEYGSPERPAVLVGDTQVQLQPKEATVGRSRPRAQDLERQLRRAQAAGQDDFMRRMVAEYDERQGEAGDRLRRQREDDLERLAERGYITRSASSYGQAASRAV